MPQVDWKNTTPDEKKRLVRQGIEEGLSVERCASWLGTSKGAVLGAAHRAGLIFGRRNSISVASAVAAAVGRCAEVPEPTPTPKPPEPVAAKPPAPAPIPMTAGVHLLDASHRHCRAPLWPDAGPASLDGYRFCGAQAVDGSSYCRAHKDVLAPTVKRSRPANGGAEGMSTEIPMLLRRASW